MSAITVTFTRDASSYQFENVINVEWTNEYSRDIMVDQTSQAGMKITSIRVNGLLKVYGDPSHNTAAQQALETQLIAIGTGKLVYTGVDDIETIRFVGLDFEEYRGSPISKYAARFVTESRNVHAHGPVQIGSQVLSIDQGFEPPQVEDSISAQGPDEGMGSLFRRKISITGKMVGTLSQVNNAQANLAAAAAPALVVVTLSLASGGVSLNVRPSSVSFSSPQQRGSQAARQYSFEGITHDDYTKEPYTIGHSQLTFGSGITIDIVNSMKHDAKVEREGTGYLVTDEKFTVSGTKFFTDWASYNSFANQFRPIPVGVHFYGPPTGYNILELRDISISQLSRDGNYASTDKRYAASISLSFEWVKQISELNQSYVTTMLGIAWLKISSTSHSFTVDSVGAVTGRSVNITGDIVDSQLTTAKSKIGTAVALGDPAIPNNGDNYYVTSVNISKTDIVNAVGIGQAKIHSISVSAAQLDTVSQRNHILAMLFRIPVASGSNSNILFDSVTSFNKSVSNKWDLQYLKFRTTAISMTMSGEIWIPDIGGQPDPSQVNKGMDFFNLFDSTHEANFNADIGGQRVPAQYTTGEYLPTNYSFFLNNLSFSDWKSFTKPVAPNKGSIYWKQTITLSATAVFDLTSGSTGGQPDWVDNTSYVIEEQTTKFQELQVMGFGTKFKAIGIDPSTAQTIIQRQYKDSTVLSADNPQPGTFTPDFPPSWPFTGANENEVTKSTFEVRGLTARWVKSWQATKEA